MQSISIALGALISRE